MRLSDLKLSLHELRDKGFVPTLRTGSTGVGYTLEQYLEVSENNLPIPDIGGRTEVKATRLASTSLITLFTFNKGVWQFDQKEVLNRFGYIDAKGRQALKSTVSSLEENTQGFKLTVDENEHAVYLIHVPTSLLVAKWSLWNLVSKFLSKFERMLFVRAEARNAQGTEEFHYVEATILSEPDVETFLSAMQHGVCMIDIRMHLNEKGGVRNRGTAIRVRESEIPRLFSKRMPLL